VDQISFSDPVVLGHALLEDLPVVHELLAACGLPTADVDAASIGRQWVCRGSGRIIGTIGFDAVPDGVVFRSLAVDPSARGRGVATALYNAAEAEARAAGHHAAYLLTETAADFAHACGYSAVARAGLPASVAAHRQFASGCCSCGTTMMKVLRDIESQQDTRDD
jgi:amino-acid N-acetyltransferase